MLYAGGENHFCKNRFPPPAPPPSKKLLKNNYFSSEFHCFLFLHLYKCNMSEIRSYNKPINCSYSSAKKGFIMNATIEKKIGQNIRKLRESRNMTQETLAAKFQLEGCDITRSAVAKIEVGQRHLYPDEILLIKRILKVSFDDIFDLT